MKTYGIERVEKESEGRAWAQWALGKVKLSDGSEFPVNSLTGLKGSAQAAAYNLGNNTVTYVMRNIVPRRDAGKHIAITASGFALKVKIAAVDGEIQDLNLTANTDLRGTQGLRVAGQLFSEQIRDNLKGRAFAYLTNQGWERAGATEEKLLPVADEKNEDEAVAF